MLMLLSEDWSTSATFLPLVFEALDWVSSDRLPVPDWSRFAFWLEPDCMTIELPRSPDWRTRVWFLEPVDWATFEVLPIPV